MIKKIAGYIVFFVLQFMILFVDTDAAEIDLEFGSVYDVQMSEQIATSSGDAISISDSTYHENVIELLTGIDKKIYILIIVVIMLFGVWISVTFMRNIFRK